MIDKEDYNKIMLSDLHWLVNREFHDTEINLKYPDNINFNRSCYLNPKQEKMPSMLKESGLLLIQQKEKNSTSLLVEHKNEKSVKYDIKRRHGLALPGYNKLENIFKSLSSQESQETKLKDLNV